jgi:DNA-directed RNA polymerase specialized sigma24 family protein
LSYREIAEIMQANETNVKTWIFRARSLLKKNINLDD